MLARHGNTCRADDMSFDTLSPQPPRQPETVPTGFIGHRYPINCVARLPRLVAPAIQQLERAASSAASFFSGRRLIPGTMPATS
jgi:hypothetical protein